MILLAMSMVMSGTGNLKVLQLCRFFHKRIGGEMNYGFHMAHHMALGLLFLGGGRWDGNNQNMAIFPIPLKFIKIYSLLQVKKTSIKL